VAFGHRVEQRDTFPKQMEEQLASTPAGPSGQRIEVLNLGVSGYNAYTELALLEDVGPRYQPDLVLVQFCINDLNDPTLHFDVQTRLHLGTIPDGAYPDPAARRGAVKRPGVLLRSCRRSRVCALMDDALLALAARTPSEEENRAAAVPVGADAGPEWLWLEDIYLRMAEVSEEMGAEFAVLAFPYPAQLKGSGPHPVARRLSELGERHGWHTVDPLEHFRAAHRMQVELFHDWWHPTAAGHRLAAQVTVSSLACAGLLGQTDRSLCRAGN
jgi:lysophospholipase L1-like esterase